MSACKRMRESSTIIIVEFSTRHQCHKQKNENSFEFSLWCHQKMSFISKWLYISAVPAKINCTSA